eukprot:TRINITY_DN15972_c0_g1_i1.p1 TRINITY_DN15972_c0_g1~~TRINITY_DN15972_c0_g1_i1.p1  ORF type:complete len:279 (+),score=50.30 TRINITY_DN15972_c0_g1_i1:93-929(+)
MDNKLSLLDNINAPQFYDFSKPEGESVNESNDLQLSTGSVLDANNESSLDFEHEVDDSKEKLSFTTALKRKRADLSESANKSGSDGEHSDSVSESDNSLHSSKRRKLSKTSRSTNSSSNTSRSKTRRPSNLKVLKAAPFVPTLSTKPLTIPDELFFHTEQRKRTHTCCAPPEEVERREKEKYPQFKAQPITIYKDVPVNIQPVPLTEVKGFQLKTDERAEFHKLRKSVENSVDKSRTSRASQGKPVSKKHKHTVEDDKENIENACNHVHESRKLSLLK